MKKFSVFLCSVLLVLGVVQVHATTIIAPDLPHRSYNAIPFGTLFAPGRYQQIFDSSIFPGAVEIQSLAFSLPYTSTYNADLEIRLTQTSVAVGALSTTLDDNITGSLTTVLNESSFSLAVTGGSEAFGLVFDFSSTPFLYDPSWGENFLFDIVINSFSIDPNIGFFGASSFDPSSLSSRAFAGSDYYSDSAGEFGLRTQITFTEATPVPEPATMFLLGTGLIGLAGISRKKFFKRQ